MDTDIKQATATADELRIEIGRYRSLCDTKDELLNKVKTERDELLVEVGIYRKALCVELMRNP